LNLYSHSKEDKTSVPHDDNATARITTKTKQNK